VQSAAAEDKALLSAPDNVLAEHPQVYGIVTHSSASIRTANTTQSAVYPVSAIFVGLAMAILAGALFLTNLLSYVMAFFLILAVLAGVISQGFGSAVSFFKG